MTTYIVTTRSIMYCEYVVEASDPNHARDIVERGDKEAVLIDIYEEELDIVSINSPT